MRRLPALLLMTLCLPPTARAQSTPPQTVSQAVARCRTDPGNHPTLWVRGFFVPNVLASAYVEGVLFPMSHVPPGPSGRWALAGRWKKYGALSVHVDTHASFGERWLVLHGRLDCASWRIVADRDPFPMPQLHPRYSPPAINRSGGITTSVVAGGIRLSISIPAGPHPRDALVAVHVSMRNVTRHNVLYWTHGPPAPGYEEPQAEVLDVSGRVLYPPALPQWLPLPGPAPFAVPLHPGQTVGGKQLVVLGGDRIRVTQPIDVGPAPTNIRYPPVTISTLPISLQLTAEAPPQVRLSSTGGSVEADIVPPPGATGRMFSMQYSNCGDMSTSNQTIVWTASAPHLATACSNPSAWYVVAGWLNHPVARIQYVKSGQMLAPEAGING